MAEDADLGAEPRKETVEEGRARKGWLRMPTWVQNRVKRLSRRAEPGRDDRPGGRETVGARKRTTEVDISLRWRFGRGVSSIRRADNEELLAEDGDGDGGLIWRPGRRWHGTSHKWEIWSEARVTVMGDLAGGGSPERADGEELLAKDRTAMVVGSGELEGGSGEGPIDGDVEDQRC